jgi:hypothetical protein
MSDDQFSDRTGQCLRGWVGGFSITEIANRALAAKLNENQPLNFANFLSCFGRKVSQSNPNNNKYLIKLHIVK